MQVNELSPQDMARIRKQVKPMNETSTPQFGDALIKEMMAGLSKPRGGK